MDNMNFIEKYSIFIVILFLVQVLPAQSAHDLHREGDRQYKRSNYEDAETTYRQALDKKPNDPDLGYNIGNALYRQGQYAESEPFFERAGQAAKDPGKRADALHNLGNACMLQGKFREAEAAYEKSLRLRPGDPETKVNLQLAKKMRKKEAEKQKQQPPPQQSQGDQQQQDQQQQEQQQNQDQQQPQDQQQSQNQQQPQDQDQQPQPQAPDGRMTPEQARRLLETAVAPEDQRNAKKYREKDPGKHLVQPKKDW